MTNGFWDLNWLGRTEEYEDYKRKGGGLGYEAWKREGKPAPPTQITPYARQILERTGGVPGGTWPAAPTGMPTVGERIGVQGALRETEKPTQQPELAPGLYKTYEEAATAAPPNYIPIQNEIGLWGLQYKAPKEAAPQPGMPEGYFKTHAEAMAAAPEGYVPVQQAGGWWGLKRDPQQQVSPYEQERLGLEREQMGQSQQQWQGQMDWYKQQAEMQQAEQERQYASQLAAQPRSWLEYAAYTGATPTIQPWMAPLMPEQYGVKIGEEIPGYSPATMGVMPELTKPSQQLWGRMGPTSQQQYLGYRQARTGLTPEESQWRMWATAPPGGQSSSLRWAR